MMLPTANGRRAQAGQRREGRVEMLSGWAEMGDVRIAVEPPTFFSFEWPLDSGL